ncbi:MAG: hypothetical protein MI810_08415 [Flavobacteriales bacterium]|nr:hypothetical protein [Flavobacteriales bacterium]
MENKRLKYWLGGLMVLLFSNSFSQGNSDPDDEGYTIITNAERTISPSYRITEKPAIIDTVIPTPKVEYPLLSRNMHTEISMDQIEPSKVRIIEKLPKLYPGYVKLGIGNYASPLGELYFNSLRNRRVSYGLHAKHNSSFGNIKGWAPSSFDNTRVGAFGEFNNGQYRFETEANYLNNGYHFYGIEDTTDFFSKDSLKNRVQGFHGGMRLSNTPRKDSATLLWTAKTDYVYFHEFKQDWDSTGRNARNHNYFFGGEFAYKLKKHLFRVDADFRINRYWAGENDMGIDSIYRKDHINTLIHLRPYASTYGDKWKVVYGVDINFDFPSEQTLQIIPALEAKYSLLNDMAIPYIGVGGGVTQNSFHSLNRQNQFITSSIDLLNTRKFDAYAGIKGTLSKNLSYNMRFHFKRFTNLPLFVNDTAFSDLYQFTVVYDRVDMYGGVTSLSYQMAEKLKVDAIFEYNQYVPTEQEFAWNLPQIKMTVRGNYNLYDKILVKADFLLESGRMSPVYLYNPADDNIPVDLGLIADGNLHMEYRYNDRISVFLQFNNIAAQKYFRWYKYRVQGFQALGGVTFGF